jgi:beta-aspartyl-peptidase (threonine type)
MGLMERRSDGRHGWVLAVHGGAGDGIARLSSVRLDAARRALETALRAGAGVLDQAGGALAAVVEAVKVLEDSPEFNAGRGAVLTSEGKVETDAGVADGHSRRAAGVAACRGVRNPVEAARAVMDRTDHVLVVGDAVADLAQRWGLEMKDADWFTVDPGRPAASNVGETVGAVARDVDGHLAAATSTGGRAGQRPGRVGDSPVIGAGLWADDRTCAVSATGDGEAFVLAAFAHEVDALMRLSGLSVGAACDRALEEVARRGGRGGCIAVDAGGAIAMPFTTAAMYRGRTDASGELLVETLRES